MTSQLTFDQFKISPDTLDAIAAMGYETPSPIQEKAIPIFLSGRDILAQARTGTGKTAAFGIPFVERFRDGAATGIVGLVLVPTRELAIQVAQEITDLAKASKLRVVTIYGGVGYGKQVEELRRGGTILLVATPGRLIDFLGQGTFKLDRISMLVLDEADRMLDMGFLPDMERILRQLPVNRQTGLFSATVPDQILKLTQKFLKDPERVRVEAGPTTTSLTDQFVIKVEKSEKPKGLLHILNNEQPERGIVFVRMKHMARRLADQLQEQGWTSVPLQGNMSQNQRERAMEAFRSGAARILVATDVAARGIDVPELSHVINLDLPDEPESYVHRIGRTGRMGKTGRAITFVQSDEHTDWKHIQKLAGITVPPYPQIDLRSEPLAGPDMGKPGIQYKGLPSGGGGPQGGHGRGRGAGHHAKKNPSGGGGRSGGHHGVREHRGGARSSGGGRGGGGGGRSSGRSARGSHGFSRDQY